MGTQRIVFRDFRDENERSRYPFADGATLKTTDGRFAIDNGTFLDASIYAVGSRERTYISAIVVEPRKITIHIGDAVQPRRCFAEFDPFAEPYELRILDSLGRDCGILVTEPERAAVFSTWSLGTHVFNVNASEFVASCVIPTPEVGVRGILTEAGELLTGDAWIVGDNGVVVREDEGNIRVDIVGDPLFVRKACVPLTEYVAPRFLKTINNCGPDAFGNVNLTVGDHFAENTILRIYPDGTGLRIEAVGRKVQG